MKTNWQTKKLGEICLIKTGKKDVNQGNPNGKYPFFTCAKGHTFSNEYSFDTEALLIAGNGDVGNVSYYKGKFEAYQRTYVLSEFRDVLPKYLYLYLGGFLKSTVSKQKLGNTMPYIKMGMLFDFEIPIPTIPEQKEIVKVLERNLERINKVKENTEKNLQNSKELFETYLNDIFSNPGKDWEERKLEYVCEITSTLIDPKKKEYLEMLHIGAGNMVTKSEVLIGLKTAKEERLISGKFLFDTTMVLYSKIRPYLMKVVRPKFDGLCSADIYPLKPLKKMITRDFLFYVLLSKDFTDYAIKGSARAGMPKVNREHLFVYTFYLPSITEQKQIVRKLDQLSEKTQKLESLYKQKLESIGELKKSILSKAFSKGL